VQNEQHWRDLEDSASLLLILTGMSLAEIGDLDLLTFNALLTSVIRVTYTHRTEAAWTALIAAQGTKESMEKWVGGWERAITGEKPKKKGMMDFLKAFGKGF